MVLFFSSVLTVDFMSNILLLFIFTSCICCFYRCSQLKAEWEELQEACNRRAAHLSKAVTREQV